MTPPKWGTGDHDAGLREDANGEARAEPIDGQRLAFGFYR
jgi:hypothetical protein